MVRSDAPLALSTGQAARYCFVTSESILNWIRTERLPAQRTPGGQYRIQVRDLREFLLANEMSTRLLDEETGVQPYCWEFHCGPARDVDPLASVCHDCPVHRAGARACYELHALLPPERRQVADCAACDYYHRYGPGDGPEE